MTVEQEAQKHYDLLLNKGELKQVFPSAKESWEVDGKRFTKLYEENIKFVLDYEKGTLIEDEDEDYVEESLL